MRQCEERLFCNISVAVTNRDLTADLKPEIVCCGVNEKEKVLFNINKTYLARRKELESLTKWKGTPQIGICGERSRCA